VMEGSMSIKPSEYILLIPEGFIGAISCCARAERFHPHAAA